MHSGRERRVHLEVTWFSVCCAFDFRYATELVIVTHELFVLASTRREAGRAFHEGHDSPQVVYCHVKAQLSSAQTPNAVNQSRSGSA
jgi:hypothetical protein